MAWDLLYVVVGFILLSYAADKLVVGASALAIKLGVTPTVIGLTVVAFGTSLPELVVSVQASLENNPEIAVGNVVGSNILNVALILGIAAVIQPITVQKEMINRDVPIMIFTGLLLWFLARDRLISQTEGLILLLGIFAYTIACYTLSTAGEDETESDQPAGNPVDATDQSDTLEKGLDEEAATLIGELKENPTSKLYDLTVIMLSLTGLVVGARILLMGAINVAKFFEISEEVIGLTLIAFGTSLPELATTVAATLRNKPGIAVGNIIGSNIFNTLGILGVAAIVLPLAITEEMIGISIPLMAVISLACLPVMRTGYRITRLEGVAFLAAYAVYIHMLFQTNQGI